MYRKQIEALEKERKREVAERKERYDRDLEEAFKQENAKEPGRLSRILGNNGHPESKVVELKEHALVNVEALKEFIKYGSNKVLDQIRIRNQAEVIAREEIARAKGKKEFDGKQIAYTILIMAIIGVMAYVVIINFLDYSTVTKDLTSEKIKVGDISGQLAACQSELSVYKPGGARTLTPPAQTSQLPDSGGGNVIQG